MEKSLYHANNLNKFINWEEYKSLKKIHIVKGEEVYLGCTLFIIKGDLEVFCTDINGEQIKLRSLTAENILIGIANVLKITKVNFHYIARSDTILLEISNSLEEKLQNNIEFFKFLTRVMGKHMERFTATAILVNKYSSQYRLKKNLKQEMDEGNIVYLKNVREFTEKHGFNRATFYRELKKLEDDGWLVKEGKIIRIK